MMKAMSRVPRRFHDLPEGEDPSGVGLPSLFRKARWLTDPARQPRITSVLKVERVVAEYQFQLRDIDVSVRIKLWRDQLGTGPVRYKQSHHIETPIQRVPFESSFLEADSEKAAVDKVLAEFSRIYNFALSKGGVPHRDWLVPDADF